MTASTRGAEPYGLGQHNDTLSSPSADPSRVLVVGRSHINRLVVAGIVEQLGLRPTRETPEGAFVFLLTSLPGTIILDGGNDNHDCDMLIDRIEALRRSNNDSAPAVIMLSSPGSGAEHGFGSAVDAMVAKPITPERLQPVIDGFTRQTWCRNMPKPVA